MGFPIKLLLAPGALVKNLFVLVGLCFEGIIIEQITIARDRAGRS
jgi:hypothetical protein